MSFKTSKALEESPDKSSLREMPMSEDAGVSRESSHY